MPATDCSLIKAKIQEIGLSVTEQTIFEHVTIHKAFELYETKPSASCTVQNIGASTKIVTDYSTKIVGGTSNKGISGIVSSDGSSGKGSFIKGGDGGFHTK